MPAKKRGSALISALFIMTLVAIAATAMSTRLQLDIYRTRLAITSDQLYLASQAVTFWAMDNLAKKNNRLTKNDKEGKLPSFPFQLQGMYPDVVLKGALYDLQASFNLNNLQNNKFQPMFYRFLENTLAKSEQAQRKALFLAITNWISPYQPDRGQDEYLDYYLKQNLPYLPSYQSMQNISELRLVRGVTHGIYQKLLPNLTVLPELTPININTASTTLLMSLGNGLSESQADDIIQARGKNGIKDLKKVFQLLQKLDIPNDQITIESQYYLSVASATSEDLSLNTYTVIKRSKDKRGQISVGIVSESLNTM